MKTFKGTALFLDRSDINTDEIIPAKYLTEITKEALKPHLLEDLDMPGFTPASDVQNKSVIITRSNFGCGSSREHAPWALEVNGINVVLAASFARIFRQNMFNCGMLAIELAPFEIEALFDEFSGSDTDVTVDVEAKTITAKAGDETKTIPFELSEFNEGLVRAGGWVDYADERY